MLSTEEIKKVILKKGCFSPEENERIYVKWFQKGPRRVFREALKLYKLDQKLVCDVGCAYGTNLFHCGTGSYGIEIEEYPVRFAQAVGLKIYQRDIFGDVSGLPKADVVWNSSIIEHIESPHIFLRKLHLLLKDRGLLILNTPTIPRIRFKFPKIINRYQSGFSHGDHINAFTPQTLKFFCERAGFATLRLSPFFPSPFSFLNRIPFFRNNTGHIVYVGEKIPQWEYPAHSTRRVAANEKGFVFKGQDFPKRAP